ncbi:MAG: hypothetical protein K9N01_11325 [Cephaloticoccus sp.]|nr:hypothetical protein [Cephaloticoccus sp.]
MNLIWHIIKKDFRSTAWGLLMWAVCLGYLFTFRKIQVVQWSFMDNLGVYALFAFAALTVVLIAAIVQEDGLTGNNEFWRTRPISGGRLLAAKMILIGIVFLIGPYGLSVIHSVTSGKGFNLSDMVHLFFGFGVVLLSFMAMAASTKDLALYILGGILCCIGVALIGPRLAALIQLEPVAKTMMYQVGVSKLFAILVLCGFASLFVLLNQYLTRRTLISVSIISAAVVGVTLVDSFWRLTFAL